MIKKFKPTFNLLDKSRPLTQQYLEFIKFRNSIWADKYIRRVPVDYRGDMVMQSYLFNNTWRECDKFSREEIRRLRACKSLADQLKIILIGRHVLSFPALDLLLDKSTKLKDVYAHWEKCKQDPDLTFVSNAISMYPKQGNDRAIEIFNHRNEVFEKLDELEAAVSRNDRPPIYLLCKFPQLLQHVGMFRAYEFYTSLTYTEHCRFREDDIFLVGPGAIDGLTYVTGYEFNEVDCNAALLDLKDLVLDELKRDKKFVWIPKDMQGSVHHKEEFKFTVRTLEDSLCEFRKYTNIKMGTGRRRKYVPTELKLDKKGRII